MDNIREELAKLEHQQWMHWSQYVAENHDIPKDLRAKWEENWKPYEELTEKEKDKDRKWADKAINKITEHIELEDLKGISKNTKETLNEEETWIIVENLINNYYKLLNSEHYETSQETANLLDKLSPNWRDADACSKVETKQITVKTDE